MTYLILFVYFVILLLLVVLNPFVALVFILITSIFFKANFATIKGAIGESRINKKLASIGEEYQVYHDIYVEKSDGTTTQIDHVVLSPYGIFVIETKNYTGWIFGNEKQKNWTQVIYKNKGHFYNPILQNMGHIRALKEYLNKDVDFHSIIVFSNEATFKFDSIFTDAHVIQNRQLLKLVKNYNVVEFSPSQYIYIKESLDKLVIKDRKQKRKMKKNHIEQLKGKTSNITQKKINPPTNDVECTKCSGQMKLKSGKYGKFYGCSNYPVCRHTVKLEAT
ncbi:MAG: NERD domain-containing protein [Solibacillus sp.]